MATASSRRYLNFDRVAHQYDATRFLPSEVRWAVVDEVVAAVPLRGGEWLLDGGVGTGRFAIPLAQRGVRVIGVDVSSGMMRQLQDKRPPPNLYLIQGDLRRLPLAPRSVQAVFLAHVLHLIADWQQVILECRRVLGAGGCLVLLYESGKRFPAREYYWNLAEQRGLLRPALGARRVEDVVHFLHELGSEVLRVSPPTFRWRAQRSHREVLEEVAQRTYSQLWEIPDSVHYELLEQTRRYVREQFGSEDSLYTTEASVQLYLVRFPQQ